MAALSSNPSSNPNPATKDAGEASTSGPPFASTSTKKHPYPIPSVISPIEKEIVAASIVRLDWYARLSPKYILVLGPSAKDVAVKVMNEDAQKSEESQKAWTDVFKKGKVIRREDLLKHDIFGQDTWRKLYACVVDDRLILNGIEMSPQELLGGSDEETRENLKRWEGKRDRAEVKWRRLTEMQRKEWEMQQGQKADHEFILLGLPPRESPLPIPEQEDIDSFIPTQEEKWQIVGYGLEKVWQFADDVYKTVNYILRSTAQKHPKGPRIWQQEFMDPDTVHLRTLKLFYYSFMFSKDAEAELSELLVDGLPALKQLKHKMLMDDDMWEQTYNVLKDQFPKIRELKARQLFSEDTWEELYQVLTEEFPELKGIKGWTHAETIENLGLWSEVFDTTGKRPFRPGKQARWDKRIDRNVTRFFSEDWNVDSEKEESLSEEEESENKEDKGQNENKGEKNEEDEDQNEDEGER